MTRIRQRRSRERRGLTADERSDLGHPATSRRPSAFASEAERRAAWGLHRESIMAAHQPGQRPEGWWSFESDAPAPLREALPTYAPLDRPVAEQAAARVDQDDRADRRLSFLAWSGELASAEINAIRDGPDAERKLALIAKATARD